jgi:NhaP-type Na+/H+ or K+/H+ antiporter
MSGTASQKAPIGHRVHLGRPSENPDDHSCHVAPDDLCKVGTHHRCTPDHNGPVGLVAEAEITVLISLFTTGLKLGLPLSHWHWRLPVRLAFVSMALTVALIAIAGMVGFGLSLGAAVLLGAILAPTDPVLALEVQVEDAHDRDRLRFSLTGEGSLNDGTAFPFMMLGLGLLGLHDLGTAGWRWFVIDFCWAIAGGLLIGGSLGALIGKLVVYLRTHH